MQVADAQASKLSVHIPYRESRLTFLLKDSIGGNSKTLLIANVSPSEDCGHETLSTLQFADRVKAVKNHAVVNTGTVGDLRQLQAEVSRLQTELQSREVSDLKPLLLPLICWDALKRSMHKCCADAV